MRLFLLSTLLFLLSENTLAQVNLVKNGSFEELATSSFKPCEYNKIDRRFTAATVGWNTFSGLTPDLLIWNENCAFPKPPSGKKMVGIITYNPGMDTGWNFDYHEFVQGELVAPMKKGETYEVSFLVNQNDSVAVNHLYSVYGRKIEVHPAAAGNLGVYFSTRRLDEDQDMGASVKYEALFPQLNRYEPITTAAGEWAKLSFNFEADQPYRFFTIGNFKPDEETQNTLPNDSSLWVLKTNKKGFWGRPKRIAYYCLDDVRISVSNGESPPDVSEILSEKKTYTFQNVTFASGKSELLLGSEKELDGLADFLKKNPEVHIEIEGHTDNVGQTEDNRSLSEKRAAAVANYLINKQINRSRIKWTGHGESHPIAPNDSTDGRAKNRRVEVRIQ